MMALMKIARIKTGTSTDDCFVDLAGYAACGGEIASDEKMCFLSVKGRITVRELRELLDFKCGFRDSVHENYNIYYEGDRVNDNLGWGGNVVINYTGDGSGRYILILPYPTVLDNKEDI